jgi:hypothetical protein
VEEHLSAESGDWSHRFDENLVGFSVDTEDGEVGRVSYVTYARDYMVIDIGRIFRRRVVVPTLLVEDIDAPGKRVEVPLTRDELRSGPAYEPGWQFDPDYLESVALYYDDRLSPRGNQ